VIFACQAASWDSCDAGQQNNLATLLFMSQENTMRTLISFDGPNRVLGTAPTDDLQLLIIFAAFGLVAICITYGDILADAYSEFLSNSCC